MFLYIVRRMVRVRNSTMSPEFRLNSLFHSVPVKGDYKLSKKNEILVDLFLNTLFHAVPPQSPLPPFPSFLPTKFARSFHFSPISAPLPTGSLRVEVRSEATWLGHVAERDQPGNKGLCCWRSVARCQTFTFTPSPPASVWRKTPAGMLQWGAVSAQSSEAAKFGCCHEESHTGNSSAREKVGNKRRWRTSASARGQRPLWSPHHRTMSGLVWLSGYILWKRLIVEPFLLVQKQIFNRLIWKKKMPNWNNTLWNEMKAYWFLSATDVLKILRVEFCR